MRHTPWGLADSAEPVAPGIIFYSTPSHGGYHVSPAMNERIPAALRLDDGWYEEDCDWPRVVLAFPKLFPEAQVAEAKETLRAWCPRAYERFYGVTLAPGESYMLDHHPEPACEACLLPLSECECSQWCEECRCMTNHSEHPIPVAEDDDYPFEESRWE